MEKYLVIRRSSVLAEVVEIIEEGDLLVRNVSFLSSFLLEKLKEGNTVDEAVSHLAVNLLNSKVLKPLAKQLTDAVFLSEVSLPHLDLSEAQVALLAKKINVVKITPLARNAFQAGSIEFNWQLTMYSDRDFFRFRSVGKKTLDNIHDYSRDLFGDDYEDLFVKIRTHFLDILNRHCFNINELNYISSYQKIIPFLMDPENARLKDIAPDCYSLGLDPDVAAMQPDFGNEKRRQLLKKFHDDCSQLLMSTLTRS